MCRFMITSCTGHDQSTHFQEILQNVTSQLSNAVKNCKIRPNMSPITSVVLYSSFTSSFCLDLTIVSFHYTLVLTEKNVSWLKIL